MINEPIYILIIIGLNLNIKKWNLSNLKKQKSSKDLFNWLFKYSLTIFINNKEIIN